MHDPPTAEAAAAVQDCRVRMDNWVAILHLKEADNKEEFVFNVPRFNTKVSGGCVDEQWQVSRLKIKILWLYRCRQRHSDYQDLGQTSCTISRVRDGPSARDPDICTK